MKQMVLEVTRKPRIPKLRTEYVEWAYARLVKIKGAEYVVAFAAGLDASGIIGRVERWHRVGGRAAIYEAVPQSERADPKKGEFEVIIKNIPNAAEGTRYYCVCEKVHPREAEKLIGEYNAENAKREFGKPAPSDTIFP